MSRLRYFALRTVQTVVLLWLVITFLFLLMRLIPGDPTSHLIFQGANPETVARLQEQWGLNDPLYEQYFKYIFNFVMLDFGVSTRFQTPVLEFVAPKIFNTFILAAPGITLAYVLGSLFGTVIANMRGSIAEKYGPLPFLVFGTMPEFFLGILLIVIFAGYLNLVPTSGMISPLVSSELGDVAWWRIYFTKDFAMHYILPFSCVLLHYLYLPTFMMRINAVEVMGQDFTYYNRITGLPGRTRILKTAKHAILPVITMYPISMGKALGGLILIETVFNWPGMGYELVQAVLFRDYPVVQFVFFVIAAFVIISNFAIDIIYGVIDPRISIEE